MVWPAVSVPPPLYTGISLSRGCSGYDPHVVKFPRVTSGDDVVVSATTYLAYLNCPDQALGRLQGAYPAESRDAFRGALAHRLFARHLNQGPIDPADVDHACREEIGSGLNPKLTSLGMRPSQLSGVIREVGEIYATFKRFPTGGFREAEVFLEVEPSPGVVLRGSVDAVFDGPGGSVRLVDWKTGGLGVANDQLAFYSLLWRLARDEIPYAMEAVSVATGERMAESPTEESVQRTADTIGALVDALRQALATESRLERVAGGWCRWCPILEACPDGQAAARLFAAG